MKMMKHIKDTIPKLVRKSVIPNLDAVLILPLCFARFQSGSFETVLPLESSQRVLL